MKEQISVLGYAEKIYSAMRKGILLTTCRDGNVNTMTIGWGGVGIEWGKTIFTAFVRESRFTREILDTTEAFTVNIFEGNPPMDLIAFCGRNSGRDVDKVAHLGLHLEESENFPVPGIKEFPITLECRILHRQMQDLSDLPRELKDRYYPDVLDGHPDHHIAYYAEIENAYIIKD